MGAVGDLQLIWQGIPGHVADNPAHDLAAQIPSILTVMVERAIGEEEAGTAQPPAQFAVVCPGQGFD